MTSAGSDAFERALWPVVGAFGLEVVDSEQAGRTLRVIVEGDRPLDLDRIAEVSAAVSAFLDERPDLAPLHRYELEVSSPGSNVGCAAPRISPDRSDNVSPCAPSPPRPENAAPKARS